LSKRNKFIFLAQIAELLI